MTLGWSRAIVPGVHRLGRCGVVAALPRACLPLLRRRAPRRAARQPQDGGPGPGCRWHDPLEPRATWTLPTTTASRPKPAGPTGRRPKARSSRASATCGATSGPGSRSSTWPISIARAWTGWTSRPTCASTARPARCRLTGCRWSRSSPWLGKPDYDTSLITFRRSTKDCFVSYDGNYYSVPAEYARKTLKLKETEDGPTACPQCPGRRNRPPSPGGRPQPAHRRAGPLRQHRQAAQRPAKRRDAIQIVPGREPGRPACGPRGRGPAAQSGTTSCWRWRHERRRLPAGAGPPGPAQAAQDGRVPGRRWPRRPPSTTGPTSSSWTNCSTPKSRPATSGMWP